jgi:hypothetical protein
MKSKKTICNSLTFSLIACLFFVPQVYAHCDTMNGPVALDAQKALETRNFEIIQIWVGQAQEEELKAGFDECVAIRDINAQVKGVADKYFIETAVRLHREAEGMPFTGVKPAQSLPADIAAAEKALETGNIETVTDFLTEAVRTETRKWFDEATGAKNHKEENVESGRKWIDAYVKYIVYIHGLYTQIEAGPQHGVED